MLRKVEFDIQGKLDRMSTPTEQIPPVSGSVGNLWALVSHWEKYRAKDATNDETREALLKCAKQLRQRIEWLEEGIAKQDKLEARAETIAIWDAFMQAGWIERYNMVDDETTFWWTEKGRRGARAFLEVLRFVPRSERDVKIGALERICRALAEAGTSNPPDSPQAPEPPGT